MRKLIFTGLASAIFMFGFSFSNAAEEKDIIIKVVCPANGSGGQLEKIIKIKSTDVKKLKSEDKKISQKLNNKVIVVRSDIIDDLDERILNRELEMIKKKSRRYQPKAKFRIDDGQTDYEEERKRKNKPVDTETSSVDEEIERILAEEDEPEERKPQQPRKREVQQEDEVDEILEETRREKGIIDIEEPKDEIVVYKKKDAEVCIGENCEYLVYYDLYSKVIKYKDLLELDKNQLSLIEVYHLNILNKSEKIRQQIKKLEDELKKVVFQPVRPRVEDVRILLIKLAKLKTSLSVLNIKEALIIKKILKPKQWKTLVKLMENQ